MKMAFASILHQSILVTVSLQTLEVDKGFSKKGGGGGGDWAVVGMDVHTWIFYSGINHAVHGQNASRQNVDGRNTSQNCRGDKMLTFYVTGRAKCYS